MRTLVAIAIVCASCGLPVSQECSDIAVAGLTVHVVTATNGAPICDATVTASDGSYTETLHVTMTTNDCSYAGAYERPGTYDVTVTDPNFTAQQAQNVVVKSGTCHVVPQTLTFEMN